MRDRAPISLTAHKTSRESVPAQATIPDAIRLRRGPARPRKGIMFTPNLGVNDVNERPSETSSGAVMFTMSTTSTTLAWMRIPRADSVRAHPRRPHSARRVHVNDSDRQYWRHVYTNG